LPFLGLSTNVNHDICNRCCPLTSHILMLTLAQICHFHVLCWFFIWSYYLWYDSNHLNDPTFCVKKVAESLKSKIFSFQLHIYHCHGFLRDICIGVIPYKNSNSQVCVPVKQRGSFGNKYSFWSGYWQKNIQWQGDVIFCIFLYTIKDFS
jgi:hypothetical protein